MAAALRSAVVVVAGRPDDLRVNANRVGYDALHAGPGDLQRASARAAAEAVLERQTGKGKAAFFKRGLNIGFVPVLKRGWLLLGRGFGHDETDITTEKRASQAFKRGTGATIVQKARKTVDKGVADRLREALDLVGLSQKTAAQMADGTVRGIQDNVAGKTAPGSRVLAALVSAGVNANWVLAGIEPKLLKELSIARHSASQYQPVNIETLTAVVAAVELLLAASTPADRADLVALTYDYMVAKGTSDREVLADFLRRWAKRSTTKPAPIDFESSEVRGQPTADRPANARRRLPTPVGDDDNDLRASRKRKPQK